MYDYQQREKNKYNKEMDNITKKRAGYGRSFKISSLFGFGFGFIFMAIVLIVQKGQSVFIYILPLLCGSVAGIAGILGNYMDSVLSRKGILNELARRILIFLIVLPISILITLFGIYLFDSNFSVPYLLHNNLLYGMLLGCIFGLFVMFLEYHTWKTKKRMLTLELENKFLEELAEKDELLKETSNNLYITEERNRMARELHDSISQGIHGVIYSTKSLQYHLNQENIDINKLKEITDHLEKTADVTLSELRSMILELKPALLEDRGLYQALTLLLDLFSKRQQINIKQEIEEINGLIPEQEVAIYRIVQEALTNIQKHSDAEQVIVSLRKKVGQILLSIKDNGKGFYVDEKIYGNGLQNMKIRSQKNGGKMEIKSDSKNGTTIKVIF